MLRTRFTFAVAAAVATVTLAVAAVAFLVVRADLQNQLKQQLRQQASGVHREARHSRGHLPTGWVPPHSDRFGSDSPYTQVVTASGTVWAAAGDHGLLAVDPAAAQVAAGQRGAYYSEATLGGVRAMIFTTPLGPALAVQLAVPLNTVDTQVASVGATLALLSAVGVGLAALAGWAVARAGLAPVSRLAAVAEQVTATGDPARRVEVDRADELGRLATSFNTMLRALQRSLAAQRQLVSDASHELRTPLTSLRINVELLADDPGPPAAACPPPPAMSCAPRGPACASTWSCWPMIPACPRPSVSRCSTGWSLRSLSSATWWAASPSWPGASPAPARTARSTCTRWPPPPWRRPGGTGRGRRSRPIPSRAASSAAD